MWRIAISCTKGAPQCARLPRAHPHMGAFLSSSTHRRQSTTAEGNNGALEGNPFADKYRQKLEQRLRANAGSDGAKNPEAEIRKYFNLPDLDAEKEAEKKQGWSKLYEHVRQVESKGRHGAREANGEQRVFNARRLSEILDIEKITDLSGEAIIKLWNTHFSEMKDKPYIHATISPEAYAVFATKAATCPMFVYALSRDGGFEFFVSQYSNHQVFFTSLLEYKTHGENARSLVTLTNYIDLLKEKGIVLTLAEFDSKTISSSDAATLLNKFRTYYEDVEKFELVRIFNHEPGKFEFSSVTTDA